MDKCCATDNCALFILKDRGILKSYKQQFKVISTGLWNLLAQRQKQLYLNNEARRSRAIWLHDESH